MVEERGQVDIFSYLKLLRSQRQGLVGSREQYRLLYGLVWEQIICGDTQVTVDQWKESKDKKTMEEFEREMDNLDTVTRELSQGDCAGGHRVENRSKNRSNLILPPDIQ